MEGVVMSEQNQMEPEPGRGQKVEITVNGEELKIHPGPQSVADIKKAGAVPAAMELEQVVGGKLTPLPDDASVTIAGGEIFISHVRDSKSS
jgi:hypothetical protein